MTEPPPIEENLAWDGALTRVAAALSSWREKGPPKCARCGVSAEMSLSVASTAEAPYSIRIDWSQVEPGWASVHVDGKRDLYCPKCKPAVAALLKIPPGLVR